MPKPICQFGVLMCAVLGAVLTLAHGAALADESPISYFPIKLIDETGEHQLMRREVPPNVPDLEIGSVPFEYDILIEDSRWPDDLVGTQFDPTDSDIVYVRFDAGLKKIAADGHVLWSLELDRDKDVTTSLYVAKQRNIAYLGMLAGDIHILDTSSGIILQTFHQVCRSGCLALDRSLDEQTLVVGDGDGSIRLIHASSGAFIASWQAHDFPVRAVSITQGAQGSFVVSHDWVELVVHNLDEQREERRIADLAAHGYKSIWLEALETLENGSMMAIGRGKTVRVLDIRNGELWREFGPTYDTALVVHVPEDGHSMMEFSRDHLLYRWDIDAPEERTLGYARAPLFSVFIGASLSHDGSRLAVASVDPELRFPPKMFQRVRIYNIPGI